jgi:signal peptidase I
MVQKTATMQPTISDGETIEVNTTAYSVSSPARWDVVIFQAPFGGGQWCFRIVGLPGEVINFTDVGITINGNVTTSPPHFKPPFYKLPEKIPGVTTVEFPYTIPINHYFVLGDNIKDSLDSRYWGGIEAKKIVGKVNGK